MTKHRVCRLLTVEELEPRLPPAALSPLAPSTPLDYAIITTSAIAANSGVLPDFVAWKQGLGYSAAVVTEAEWGGGVGDAAAEHIRAWLSANYAARGIEYVLLIGNPDPASGDVPMKMSWPMRRAGSNEATPTDFYYATLTTHWDPDGNGYYGEWQSDITTPPAYNLLVGRIPFYGVYDDLDHILQKTIAYEAQTDVAWRKSVLMPMAISNYANEDRSGWPRVDGQALGQHELNDLVIPAGWDHYSLYEKAGINPASAPADAPLSHDNVLSEWQKGYGVVAWWGHANQTQILQKYWAADDGDGVPETAEIHWTPYFQSADAALLDDTHPAFVLDIACSSGYPEASNNLAYSLLKNGAVGVVSATRTGWYALAQWTPQNASWWGDMGSYEYNALKLLVSNPEITFGAAAFQGKEPTEFGMQSMSWMNMATFNLYGDPSLSLAGDHTPPSAALNTASAVKQGGVYTFTVTYSDDSAVKLSSLGGNEIRVTDPDGNDQWASLLSVNARKDGTQITATYGFPASTPTSATGAVYTVWIEPDLVKDTRNNSVPGGELGTLELSPAARVSLQYGKPRRFLDGDGSTVTITLSGPGGGYFALANGETSGAAIATIVLEGTTNRTSLTVASVGGRTLGTSLGSLTIEGLTAFGSFTARGIAVEPGGTIVAQGGIGAITVGNIGAGARVSVSTSLAVFTAGTIGDGFALDTGGGLGAFTAAALGTGAEITAGGDIRSLRILKGGAANATITAGLGIGTVTIGGGGFSGALTANGATGIGPITISNGNLSAVIHANDAASGIRSLVVNGAIISGTEMVAGTGGIGLMQVKGDANVTVRTAGRFGPLVMPGPATAPRTLAGLFDVKMFVSLSGGFVAANGLTIRSQQAVGNLSLLSMTDTVLSAAAFGNIAVGRNVTDSMVLAGYDIGPGLRFAPGYQGVLTGGKGNIGAVVVGGDMTGTSIAANVAPGPDGLFGTADDVVLSPDLAGAIRSLTVKGQLTGSTDSGEHFGIVAHQTIGVVTVAGRRPALPWPSDPVPADVNIRILSHIG